MLTHQHIISATLSAGEWSENVVLNSTELASIIIIPTDANNTYTFKITSPDNNLIYSAKVTGRLDREPTRSLNGTYTLAITGATIAGDTVNGELGFRR